MAEVPRSIAVAVAAGALCLWSATAAVAAEPSTRAQATRLEARVNELEVTLASLRAEYDARLTAIERELAALRGGAAPAVAGAEPAAAQPAAATADMSAAERAALERELAEILGETPAGGETSGAATAGATGGAQGATSGGEQRFGSQTRNLNRLNPEISAAGDIFGTFADRTGDPEANQFRFAEFEVSLKAQLDPYANAGFFVVQEGGEFKLEEGWIEYNALPGGLGVKAGEMRLDWGKVNRWHQHALPQADRPLALQAIWGEEGLGGLGASVSWLAPSFLGDYNEVVVQVTNDDNDAAFSGRGFDQPVFLIHETNYFDLTDAAYLEVGLSAATGTSDFEGNFRNQVYGTDWNFNWVPPEASLYRGFELRGELLWQRRDGPGGVDSAIGTYTYGLYKLNRRSFVGLRGDWTELPEVPGASMWGVSPYYEWWQSEWTRFRLQYSYNSRQFEASEPEHRFFIQLTWAIGPHKHEKY